MNSGYIEPYFESGIEFKEQRRYFVIIFSVCISKVKLLAKVHTPIHLILSIVFRDNAEKIIDSLRIQGLRQRERSYEGVGEACLASALSIKKKGLLMNRYWSDLTCSLK